MQNPRSIIYNIAFALNCLLAFLVVFDDYLRIPGWLQVVGRMHPLVLHFPIVLLVLCITWELFMVKRFGEHPANERIGDALLICASIASAVTALMGLFLSKEDGYTAEALFWHKWAGVFISFFMITWYVFRNRVRRNKPVLVTASLAGLVMIFVTGHQGANLTHGENFLLSPVMNDMNKPVVKLEDAMVYADLIHPILQVKCMSCHSSSKAKGQLIMETAELLQKGGKHGTLWDTTSSEPGLLMQRIHLPEDDKKHMPPAGKPPLTSEEIEILYRWIKGGTSFTAKVVELAEDDSLRILASSQFEPKETDIFSFAAADDNQIAQLSNAYRVVQPVAAASPGLNVEFFGTSQYKTGQLKELLEVKKQVVSLNLNKMPVTDEDLATIGQFINLRKLNLSFTKLTGASLGQLANLKELRELSLSGTSVTASNLRPVAVLPKLNELTLWKTNVTEKDIASLQKQFTEANINLGFNGKSIILPLNAPLIENEEVVIKEPVELKMKHYINGVTLRYTTDGSEPDSLTSPVYNNKVIIDKSLVLKARAFKPGWISSPLAEKTFYRSARHTDSVRLLTLPNPEYKGNGGLTLIDGKKGALNVRDGKWLGYKDNPLEAILYFDQPETISSINFSSIVETGKYIMPPQKIEVWGGNNPGKMRLLKSIAPPQPSMDKPGYLTGYNVEFTPVKEKYLKVVVKPVPKLPSWHRGKGDKGWAFIDELFLN